jgi:hypothetical protein
MKTHSMMLHETLTYVRMHPHPYAAITNDHLFNNRHSYLVTSEFSKTLFQVFYEESKGNIHTDAEGKDYKFVDRTENNLRTAFCPTINDLVEAKWWVFTLVKGGYKTNQAQ